MFTTSAHLDDKIRNQLIKSIARLRAWLDKLTDFVCQKIITGTCYWNENWILSKCYTCDHHAAKNHIEILQVRTFIVFIITIGLKKPKKLNSERRKCLIDEQDSSPDFCNMTLSTCCEIVIAWCNIVSLSANYKYLSWR